MGAAKLVKQIVVETTDVIGQFAEVTSAVAGANVNITGITAWGEEDKATFVLLTSDNAKALETLKAKGYNVSEKEVVTVGLENKIGAADAIAQKIKTAGINLCCVYGTTCGCADTTGVMVLCSNDNAKIVSAINN